jgi:hypothetical protein
VSVVCTEAVDAWRPNQSWRRSRWYQLVVVVVAAAAAVVVDVVADCDSGFAA